MQLSITRSTESDSEQGDDTSAAAFERVLSHLQEKINKASAKDTRLRTQHRRYRALWMLYTGFAYVLALLILVLVVGRSNWDATEYTALVVAPPSIYFVRLFIDAFYKYRTNGTQSYLEDLYKQRSDAIGKLKAATKYDSTQQLLEKYGGSTPRPSKASRNERKPSNPRNFQVASAQRTGIAPPPTANIIRRGVIPTSAARDGARPMGQSADGSQGPTPSQHDAHISAEFAPNAFSLTRAPAPLQMPPSHAYDTGSSGPKWYDRIMDVILGEDETQPRNRIALICGQCRLVNGQAPPGKLSLDSVGKWRCMACGAMNGTDSAAEKAVKEEIGSPVRSEADSVLTSSERDEAIDDSVGNESEYERLVHAGHEDQPAT